MARDPVSELETAALPPDVVGLLEGLCTTRAIRRLRDEPVPAEALRDMVFAATRAPSGSNRQPFRFLVLTDGPKAVAAKALLGGPARQFWSRKAPADGYGEGSGADERLPEGPHGPDHAALRRRLRARARARPGVPGPAPRAGRHRGCLGLPGVPEPAARRAGARLRRRHDGLPGHGRGRAAPAPGHPRAGGLAATITLGRPEGNHGPVRRRPLAELVYEESWGQAASFAVDPPGTRHTAAGPPPGGQPPATRSETR